MQLQSAKMAEQIKVVFVVGDPKYQSPYCEGVQYFSAAIAKLVLPHVVQ